MQQYNILWADDEIGLLKPHILFLEQRGYRVTPVNNGADAIEFCRSHQFDVVFLDEHMPGISGLEALSSIKAIKPTMPVVMITKDEEEQVMEEAIGAQVDDYLIKPLNRSQVLLAIKKIIDNKRLVMEKTTTNYQNEFSEIGMILQGNPNHAEWIQVYKKLVFWELQLDDTNNRAMAEVLKMQKAEANTMFCRFVKRNYEIWLNSQTSSKPLLSHRVMQDSVLPQLEAGTPCFLLVIDNLRLDQWEAIKPTVEEYYTIDHNAAYYSILPTATPYSRNAIFSGMLPLDMARLCPNWWKHDAKEGLNNFEREFMGEFFRRNYHPIKFSYTKITKTEEGISLASSLNNLFDYDFNIIVYNFVDILSHSRTDMAVIQELAPDESAYRSLTKSWIHHSPLLDILKSIAKKKAKLIITTDHGTIRVKKACKIAGEKSTNSNLRYKQGKNLNCGNSKALECTKPERFFLPRKSPLVTAMFAVEDQFFVYPNEYNYYAKKYANTFQHGGISLEEMIIPLVSLTPKET